MSNRMPNGYPTDEFLAWIQAYDVPKNGPCDLIRAIWAEWQWQNLIRWYPKTRTLKMSTGGWSGHEDIMNALEKNFVFYALYWKATLRGGHYTFRIRKIEGIP